MSQLGSPQVFLVNMIIYFITMIMILTILVDYGKLINEEISFIDQLKSMYQVNPVLSAIFILNLLSLAGFPPLIGF